MIQGQMEGFANKSELLWVESWELPAKLWGIPPQIPYMGYDNPLARRV